jgi:cytochrome c-type biogenesis protein
MTGTAEVSIFIVFIAGLLSFVSPCVLPLIPSYLSFITGVSFDELTKENNRGKIRKRTIIHSLLFVAGFSLIFILMGASASYIGGLFRRYQRLITIGGGIIIAILGLHIAGIINLRFLEREKRVYLEEKPLGYIGTVIVGITFAAGWTPCIGPILGAILVYASTREQMLTGILLLAAYSLGLGLPFILSSLAFNTFISYSRFLMRHIRVVSVISGLLLFAVGILLISNYFGWLTFYLNQIIPSLEPG